MVIQKITSRTRNCRTASKSNSPCTTFSSIFRNPFLELQVQENYGQKVWLKHWCSIQQLFKNKVRWEANTKMFQSANHHFLSGVWQGAEIITEPFSNFHY